MLFISHCCRKWMPVLKEFKTFTGLVYQSGLCLAQPLLIFLVVYHQNTIKRVIYDEECLGELWDWLQAEGLLPQVHFVPRIVLGHDFVPPVINIYVQFVRQVYFCCMPDRICRTQFGQCTLNLDMVFCLAFVIFQISSIIRARQLGFDCSVLRKFWERAGSWHFFTCFSELKQPSLDHCFLCCVCV